MNDAPGGGALRPEQILEAAEDVLSRFGPSKATVVDVARALGVSHGSVYRHFSSKVALRDAVLERWLRRISDPLEAVARGKDPAPERLRRWMDALMTAKRRRARDEAELFATYGILAKDARAVVKAHVDMMIDQIARIIAEGMKSGDFTVKDAAGAARSVFDATQRFHNPAHAAEWSNPGIDAAFEGVWSLLSIALSARTAAIAKGKAPVPKPRDKE